MIWCCLGNCCNGVAIAPVLLLQQRSSHPSSSLALRPGAYSLTDFSRETNPSELNQRCLKMTRFFHNARNGQTLDYRMNPLLCMQIVGFPNAPRFAIGASPIESEIAILGTSVMLAAAVTNKLYSSTPLWCKKLHLLRADRTRLRSSVCLTNEVCRDRCITSQRRRGFLPGR